MKVISINLESSRTAGLNSNDSIEIARTVAMSNRHWEREHHWHRENERWLILRLIFLGMKICGLPTRTSRDPRRRIAVCSKSLFDALSGWRRKNSFEKTVTGASSEKARNERALEDAILTTCQSVPSPSSSFSSACALIEARISCWRLASVGKDHSLDAISTTRRTLDH